MGEAGFGGVVGGRWGGEGTVVDFIVPISKDPCQGVAMSGGGGLGKKEYVWVVLVK